MRHIRTMLVLAFAIVAAACANPAAPEADDDGQTITGSSGMQPNFDGQSITGSGG